MRQHTAKVIVVFLATLSLSNCGTTVRAQGELKPMPVADNTLLREIYGDKITEPWKLPQEQARAATGIVMNPDASPRQTIYLDIQPCEGKVMKFDAPYAKTSTGKTVRCKGHDLPLYFVRPN